MNDGFYAALFFLIFAAALAVYAAMLVKTGDKNLLPYRAQHSITNKDQVRRVGRISVAIALVIGCAAIAFMVVAKVLG